MLVRDTPVAIDVAQSHCQPEQEPSFFRRVAERAGAAPHDGDGDGNIFAGGNCKLDYLDRLGLDALLDMVATSLWRQGGSSVSPDVTAFDQAFEVRLIADVLVDVDECDKTLMAPKLLAKSLAMSAKLPAHEVFRVRAVLAQIGWLETSVSDAAAQAVFNVELLLRSGTFESSVAIDNQLEVFRAYELG